MASASLGFEARKGTMAPLPQAERSKIEQIVAEYYAKALHIVLEARIPPLQQNEGYGSHSHRGGTTTNKWFNLELDSSAHVLESVEPWKRGICQEPMVVDIWLHQPSSSTSPGQQEPQTPNKWSSSPRQHQRLRAQSWGGDEDIAAMGSSLLLERWVVHYERKKDSWLGFGPVVKAVPVEHASSSPEGGDGGAAAVSPPSLSQKLERPVVYKRTVIMLRSLYCLVRTLPAFRLFKLATSSSHSRSFSLSYTISAAPAATLSEQDESAMMKCNLTPIETQWGRLCIYSLYRNATAVTALEVTPRILSRIIPDYVGSPTTDTLRRFPSVGSLPSPGLGRGHGVHVVQLPGSVPNSPSGGLRRHSWSGGINKVQSQPPPLPISPSYKSSSPSPSHPYHHDFQNSPPKTPHYFHHSSSPSGTHQPSNLSPRNSPLQRQFVHHHPHHDSTQPIPIHPRRSPPFSPSPSPSPPQHGYNSRSKSDPVTIPRPHTNLNRPSVIVRSSADPNHHQSRSPLPPPSPQTHLLEKTLSFNSRLQSGNSAGHVSNLSLDSKIAVRSADSSHLVSPRSRPRRPQNFGEDQGDELALSGIKRSVYSPPGHVLRDFRASRVSSQNHEDPEDVECPFAIDNVEPEDYLSRVGSPRPKVPDSPDFQGSTPGSAVGALVRVLKAAAPLRQQSAPPAFADLPGPKVGVSSSPMAIAGRGGPAKSSPPKPNSLSARNSFKNRSTDFRPTSLGAPTGTGSFGTGGIGSPPSIGVRQASSKSAADALEELRQYREMRDFLVHQSGGGVKVKR